jgi:glycosyltransferase involved in cell wall biosynthesis
MSARAVFGVPVHNGEQHLEQALRSIFDQQFDAFAVAVFDDGSSDRSPDLIARMIEGTGAASDRSERPTGLIGGWRRAYDLALRHAPNAEFFAWGSDHDVWDPRWLAALVAALDANPNAVLAHPLVDAIDDDGRPVKRTQRRFDSSGLAEPNARIRAFSRARRAGDMVYGLYRVDALRRCGDFPDTVQPDRLLLARLALEGEFVQVPEVLWHRRYRAGVAPTMERQRRALWAGAAPAGTESPWPLQHWRALRPTAGAATATAYVTGLLRAVLAQKAEQRRRQAKWARKRWRARLSAAKRRLVTRA